MAVMLSDKELAALRRALDAYLPELNFELARMKLPHERHELVELEETLRTIRGKI